MASAQAGDFVDPAEIWRDIPEHRLLGVPPGYQASSLGQIRSVPRTLRDGRQAGGMVLAQQPDKDGYGTFKAGRKRVRVNVAVQLAFAGLPHVMHLDGNRSNNKPENLAYGSKVENEQAKWETERENQDGNGHRPPLPFETLSETRMISLSEAVSQGYVSCSLAAIRKASQRDPDFPARATMDGMAKLYRAGELAVWDRRRR